MAQTQSLPQWNQQPDGFAGLKFGANKTAVEQQIKVEASSSYEDVLVLVTRFTFCEVEILGRCVFLANQLSAIAGDFALSEWDLVLSAFTETYGYNHCEVSDFWTNDVPYVGLTWTGGRILITVVNKSPDALHGSFSIATSQYMKDARRGPHAAVAEFDPFASRIRWYVMFPEQKPRGRRDAEPFGVPFGLQPVYPRPLRAANRIQRPDDLWVAASSRMMSQPQRPELDAQDFEF